MPQRDVFRRTVRATLERDGWVVTHDPLPLTSGERSPPAMDRVSEWRALIKRIIREYAA